MPTLTPHLKHRLNRHLWIGSLLVIFISTIAIWGPIWAPQDPMQNNPIVEIDGAWVAAPHPPFEYARFPLGTDQNGRDILSQVLWAVRPTMILVSIVAIVRMLIGLLVGLAAGWLTGFPGRWLNNLISSAVSAPVLIVALAIIAAVGVDLGVTAFILGMAATGWAETARLVSERTRSIRSMPYIDAARSLGQSAFGLVTSHVLRQIAPLVWMLFAFEVSSTLLTSASLGFLGYYIGGEVWTPVTDTSSVRSSGTPELGLMVATLSSDIYTGPYKMAAAGTLIFLTILGFNLLGEGLRLRLEHGSPRSTIGSLWREQAALWFDHNLWNPFTSALQRSRLLSAGLAMLLLLGLSLVGWAILQVPGNHLWASQFHDPYSTGQTGALGPHENPVVLWIMHREAGFTGGPVISTDGYLFAAGIDNQLSAYRHAGIIYWRIPLEGQPVGSPAISKEGRIYIADKLGGLTAISPAGNTLWRVQPEDSTTGINGASATSSPIVDRDGNIYYMRAGQVQAVSPQGYPLWLSQARTTRTTTPPALSPDGELIFALDAVLRTSDGLKLNFTNLTDADQFMTGADGRLYVRSGFLFAEWQRRAADSVEIIHRLEWDYHSYGIISPANQAGVTADSRIWLLYYSSFEDGHFIWLDQDGKVTGDVRFPHRETSAIGVDSSNVMYICGTNRTTQAAECLALQNDRDKPLWTLPLPNGVKVTGGAIGPGVLYVTTAEGYLLAIGEQSNGSLAP